MAKKEIKLTYTFVNPNTPREFQETLKTILMDKLLSLHTQKRPAHIQKGE